MTIVYLFVAVFLTALWILVGGNFLAAPFIASLGIFVVALVKVAIQDTDQ